MKRKWKIGDMYNGAIILDIGYDFTDRCWFGRFQHPGKGPFYAMHLTP